jgi:hypothetical protein
MACTLPLFHSIRQVWSATFATLPQMARLLLARPLRRGLWTRLQKTVNISELRIRRRFQ